MYVATIPNSEKTITIDFDRYRDGQRELFVLISKRQYDNLEKVIELEGKLFKKSHFDGSFAIYFAQ